MKKIDLKKNLEERVQYTEWTAKNTWNVLDRISSAKKAPRGRWVRRLAPVLAMVLLIAGVSVTGLWGGTGGPDTIREQYTAQPIVTALAAGQGEGIGDLEAGPADSELSVSEKLQRDYPDLAPWLQPIGMSCEKDGIRLELISGAVKGNESLIVYSLQDVEGKHAGKELSPLLDLPEVKSSDHELLYSDPKEHKYTYYSYAYHNQPVESGDQMMSMRVNGYLVQRRARLDLVKLLEKYGSEGLVLKEKNAAGKKLDTDGLQAVPVLEDVVMTGIGWAEGRLHVQFHALNSHLIEGKNHEPDESWFSSLEYDDQYRENEELYSYSGWTETGASNVSWMEHELNCTQELLEQMRPVVNIYSTDELVEGDWTVEFPLSLISDEACIEEIRSAEGFAAEEEKDYQVPRPEIYTRKAWPVTEEGYAELQANLSTYVENRQVYVVKGTVQEVLSEKPLRVKINAGEDGESLPVVLERPAGRVFEWQPGNYYDIYGEVIGEYDGMPLLLAGYSYTQYIPDVLKGVKNELKPIGLEVERQGIRMTLDSGLVRGNEAWLVYSLEDTEGKYTGMDVRALNFTSTLDTVTEESDAEHPEIIHQLSSAERMVESSIRKEDHTNWYVYWLQFPDEIDMTERTIKAGAENVKIERETIRDLDTILKEHGKTEEGITTRDYVRKAGQPAEIKVLDNAEPLNISLGSEEALLTGIGWIDGKLHVQVQKKTPSEIRKGNNTYGPAAVVMVSGIALQDDGSIDSERTNEMNGDCQPVQWTDFSTGSAQRYEEWILDCKPDEPIKLMADVVILEDMLTDDWSVEFPLSLICDEAGIEEIRSAEGSAAAEDAIRNRAEGFFAAWQERDASGMALRCVPSEWSDMTDEMIRRILAEKKLVNWQIDGMERYPDSPVMTIRCRLNTEPAEGGESSVQEYRLIAKKAKNNIWYFEPDSLLADADNVIRASEIAKENIVLLGGQDDMEGKTEDLPDYLQCLNSFLSCWSREDTAGMLAECPPEWEEEYHLSDLLAGFGKEMGIPGLWRIGQSYGTENDPMRAADCEVWLRNTPDDRDGWYHIDAQMQKGEDGKWYFIPFIASEYRPVRVKENNTAGQTVRNDLLPDGFTMEKLKAFFPEVTDSLRPLNLSCEKNSIRMELLYGGVTGYRYYLIYSLQDLEGIHPDREIEAEMKSTIGETEGDSSTILLNWDEAEHKGIYLFAQVYTNPVEHEDRTVTAKIGHIWFRNTEETDLNQILMTYGKTEEGMEAEGEILRGARESGVKVLDNSNPLNIPLGKSDIVLTGIGWIDGKLHVRIQNKGRENRVWGPDLYISNAEITARPLHYDDSENLYSYGSAALPIEWYDNDEGKVYQREDILNCAPADMDKIQLTALVSIQESVLTDDWSVEFPLSMICAEEK